MMLTRFDRCACFALCASLGLALAACIEAPISLGHHELRDPPGGADGGGDGDGDGDGDSTMEPIAGSGGQGGQQPAPDAELPEPRWCVRGTLRAVLECELQDGMFGGGPPAGGEQKLMSTTSSFTVVPRTDRPEAARVTGELDFMAWNIGFTGRIEGELDCQTGLFHAVIVGGEATTAEGIPPSPFFGELDGDLAPDGMLEGRWWHGPQPQDRRCIGPWSATRR